MASGKEEARPRKGGQAEPEPRASPGATRELRPTGLDRTLRLLREEGPFRLLRGALYHLEIYRRFRVIGLPFTRGRTIEYALECEVLAISDLDDYLRLRPDQSREEIEDRLTSGSFCVLGRRGGRPVAASWLGSGEIFLDYLNCRIRPADDTLYVYDNFVDPEYRGRKASDSVTLARERVARERGYRRLFGILLPENRSSSRRVELYRRPALGILEHFRLGPFERHRLRFDANLVSAQDPPFRLLARESNPH